jgi:hypothetical protein
MNCTLKKSGVLPLDSADKWISQILAISTIVSTPSSVYVGDDHSISFNAQLNRLLSTCVYGSSAVVNKNTPPITTPRPLSIIDKIRSSHAQVSRPTSRDFLHIMRIESSSAHFNYNEAQHLRHVQSCLKKFPRDWSLEPVICAIVYNYVATLGKDSLCRPKSIKLIGNKIISSTPPTDTHKDL